MGVRGRFGEGVGRHRLAAYLVLAFAWSWSWWVPLALSGGDGSHLAGLAGPAVAALVVTGVADGWSGVRGLARRMVRWRLAPRWYLAAAVPLVVGLVAAAVLDVLTERAVAWRELGSFPGAPALGLVGVWLLVLVVNGLGEETGWRGLLWPSVRASHDRPVAAVLVAAPWALWHLPLFWLDTGLGDLDLVTVPGWLVGLVAGSLVLGWLYDETGGSLLVVSLFHANLNMASATEATAGLPAALVSAAVIAAAVVLLRRAPR